MREVTIVNGKRIAVTTTVDVDDAEITWSDIIDAVEVVPDEDGGRGAPWDDGWEHDAQQLRYGPDHDGMRESNRYVSRSTRDGGDVWLTLDVKKSYLPDMAYYRAQGASKQVSAELAAQALRNAYAQLHKWYSDGWQYYGVKGELKGCEASVWGVDDYDYAQREVVGEIASELAGELKSAGYVVTDQPTYTAPSAASRYRDERKAGYRGVNQFNTSRR